MSNMQWNFPRGDGRKVGKRLEAKHVFTDSQRLDWLLQNAGAQCESAADAQRYISTWVCGSDPGNDSGYGARYIAYGATHRECIDKFLRGDITRVD